MHSMHEIIKVKSPLALIFEKKSALRSKIEEMNWKKTNLKDKTFLLREN